eukprot:4491525-Pleurochrysis_carterae.AAC.1
MQQYTRLRTHVLHVCARAQRAFPPCTRTSASANEHDRVGERARVCVYACARARVRACACVCTHPLVKCVFKPLALRFGGEDADRGPRGRRRQCDSGKHAAAARGDDDR